MKTVVKNQLSEILSSELKYKERGDNSLIRDILLKEQKYLCAYTETYLGRTDQKDIDHFNPLLKSTDGDSYYNWFVCKAQWNREKSSKWGDYQPILHPTDSSLEERIFYYEGNYVVADQNDIEARNLVSLLKLDDPDLASDRRRYIKRVKEDANRYEQGVEEHLLSLLNTNPERVYFLRALQEEFGVTFTTIE